MLTQLYLIWLVLMPTIHRRYYLCILGKNHLTLAQTVSQWSVPEWEPEELPNKNLLHCCPLYKKELWKAAGGYSPTMVFGWEDWEFWQKIGIPDDFLVTVILG